LRRAVKCDTIIVDVSRCKFPLEVRLDENK
jgi:hypothetical protein